MPTLCFVSHRHKDEAVAGWLRAQLERDFLRGVRVFASSDLGSLRPGDDWYEVLKQRMNECHMLLVVCTPTTHLQPWVNFELGYASALEKRVIVLYHGGLTPDDLPFPFTKTQGVVLGDADGLHRLYDGIAHEANMDTPRADFVQLAQDVPAAAEPDGPVAVSEADAARRRIRASLMDTRWLWRSIDRVATEAAITRDEALALLRADDEVRFKDRKFVGLKSRVGNG